MVTSVSTWSRRRARTPSGGQKTEKGSKRGQFLILMHEAPKALSRHGPQVEGRVRSDRGRSSEGGFGGALAGGDDDDGWVDPRASGNGHERLSEPSLLPAEEAW